MQTLPLHNSSRAARDKTSDPDMTMFMRQPDQPGQNLLSGALANAAAILTWVALGTATCCAWAQDVAGAPQTMAAVAKIPAASSPTRTASAPKIAIKPGWQDLSPSQQQSLKPLAEKWNTLGETQKRKWITIAATYPKLAPPEQEKLHSRMTEWVSLTQQQRVQARLNFAESKKLTPTQKTATWNAYQALSPEEKQKLARSAPPKPVGATAAAKPVSPQKLATVPVSKPTAKQAPKMAAAGHSLDKNTLLPQHKPAADPAVTPASAPKN
jgi:hypothetical protein